MAIKLHRCSWLWVKLGAHPCWRVQKALDEASMPYELVKEASPLARARANTEQRTGQRKLPWIEFEDGTVYREESAEMAATIRAGRLDEKRAGPPG